MSDPIIPGSLNDVGVDPERAGEGVLSLDNFGPKSQAEPVVEYKVCKVCGFIFRKTEMIRYKKEWYCKPNQCYEDIVGIRLKQNPEAYFKNSGLGDRFWKGSNKS